jgi:predicted metal-dependent peptidase
MHFEYPYYADVMFQTNFFETKEIPTAGVNVSTKGFNYYYNPEFIERLNQKEVNFVNIHEIFHLIFNHYSRSRGCDVKIANIAQDMIINSTITESIKKDFIEVPKNGGRDSALFIPKEYDGEPIFEHLYNFLLKEKEKNDGQGDGDSKDSYGPNGKKGEMQPALKDILKDNSITIGISENGESLDVHISDEVPQEIRDQMVKDAIERIKARGLSTGDFESVLGKLRKSKKDYLKEIKSGLEQILGRNKYKTWSRINRRELPFKGFKKLGTKINVILDTSGSMNGNFEKALSYIFNRDIVINLIQCDTQIQKVSLIKDSRQLKKERIKGLGGTVIQPAIDLIVSKYNKNNTLLLTDGATDNLDISGLKKHLLVLTLGGQVPISSSNGRVKQIEIKEDK